MSGARHGNEREHLRRNIIWWRRGVLAIMALGNNATDINRLFQSWYASAERHRRDLMSRRRQKSLIATGIAGEMPTSSPCLFHKADSGRRRRARLWQSTPARYQHDGGRGGISIDAEVWHFDDGGLWLSGMSSPERAGTNFDECHRAPAAAD